MKLAPIALRKSTPAPTAASSRSLPLPQVDEARLQALLQAPAPGEAVEPVGHTEKPAKARDGRQRRDTPRRRADREEGSLERLQVHLPAEVVKALRVLAATEGRSLSLTVEAELRGLLKRRGALS